MSWRAKIACLLLVLFTIQAVVGACASGNEGGPSGAVEGLKQIPSDWQSFLYVDLAHLRNDFDLRPLYDALRSSIGGDLSSVGISSSDVNTVFVGTSASGQNYGIVSGNLDFANIRKVLQDGGAEKTEYMSIETWTEREQGQTQVMVFARGAISAGAYDAAREYIEVIAGKAKSLYDDNDVRDVVYRLPNTAVAATVATGGDSFPTDETNCVAVAYAFHKIDAQTLELTCVGKFTDSTNAASSLSDFKLWSSNQVSYNLENVQSVQEGQFIKLTATLPISEIGNGATSS